VGYYGPDKKLHYAAKLRAGFTPHLKAEVFRRIADSPTGRCPFVDLPNSAGRGRWGEGITEEDMTKLKWVKPKLVVEGAFVEWTLEGLLRHPKFIGICDDKHTRDVRQSRAAASDRGTSCPASADLSCRSCRVPSSVSVSRS